MDVESIDRILISIFFKEKEQHNVLKNKMFKQYNYRFLRIYNLTRKILLMVFLNT